VSQNGKVIYKEDPQPVRTKDLMIAVGQLGLNHVAPGSYLMTMVITDQLADKKDRTVVRSMDFKVSRLKFRSLSTFHSR